MTEQTWNPPSSRPRDLDGVESQRIRAEFERRDREIPRDRYSYAHAVNQYFHGQIFREIVSAMVRHTAFPLNGMRISDIGCGGGGWLLQFCQWGAEPSNLAGIDLDENRVKEAQRRLGAASCICWNAENLPWPDSSFDIVSQFTVLTSILDPEMRSHVASEMMRVLKPNGLILWYDFRVNNPRNRSVRGIGAKEIQKLFPCCDIDLKRVTLAPPIARVVVPISWIAALLLEKVPMLRTHYLCVIRKRSH